MKIKMVIKLIFSHLGVAFFGFALGIYMLPIIIAPDSLSTAEIQAKYKEIRYSAEFTRHIRGSDALHWGEGKVSIGDKFITFIGKLAPGPDYKLYLSPKFVDTEADFKRSKHTMIKVGEIDTFKNFVVEFADDVNIAEFTTIVIWCETFDQFITAASYR
jgi:hypothetical protein